VFAEPPPSFVDGARALLDTGKGMVFLHHALAGWPAWEEWAHVVGGRFHYQPAALDGVDYPDSGYHHDVTHTVEVVDPDHPIAAGLPASFAITDEVYLAPVFEDDVEPVLASAHTFSDGNFWSADLAIRGRRYAREGWSHPPGSNLVGWVKHAGRSPVAYIQFGDGADTYADPNYRRVLANAVDWAGGADAHAWAAERRERTGRWA
jgi:type 1 glutamine amidotransferase